MSYSYITRLRALPMRKFFSYYKPYLRLFYSVMICAFIAATITLLFPLLTRHITKDILAGNVLDDLTSIYRTGAVMLGLVVIQALCNFYVDYRGHAMGAKMEGDLRSELYDHYLKLPFSFYDRQRIGHLMSRLTNDLLLLSEFYHHAPEDYMIYLVRFLGAFIILVNINARLTLLVFTFLPLMALFALYFNMKMNTALKNNKERIADINAQVEDSLSGIRVAKSYTNEELESRKFHRETARFLKSRKDCYKNEAYLFNGVNVFIQLITITVVVFGGASITRASLDLPDLITFLLFMGNLIEPVQKLTQITMQFQEGITGFERFMEMLTIIPDIRDADDAIEIDGIQGSVEFRNVSFRYYEDRDYVLDRLSLKINPGDHIALVGSSGVGKTTLCSLIPRFYDVCKGEILLDGIDIRKIKLSSLRKMIGTVQQDVYLFAGTVIDNIRYGKPDATREEIIEAAKKANAHGFIMELPEGYDSDIGQRGVRLSGGQRQRLSIARVFLKDPPILIFDEATSALDNESERIIKESLESLAKGRTAIVIAHRLSTIRNAERIIVLSDQGIDEQGSHCYQAE